MKLEVSEQFVREAHTSACSEWKQRIEEEFPSLFEVKWQIGKWHKLTWDDSVAFVYSTGEGESGGTLGYGFLSTGVWENSDLSWGGSKTTKIELARAQEIESMLWKEAEKRGFKKGVKYENAQYGNLEYADNGVFEYDYSSDSLWLAGNTIYYKGKWAKPLDPNKEIKETISRLEKELAELKEKVSPTQDIGW